MFPAPGGGAPACHACRCADGRRDPVRRGRIARLPGRRVSQPDCPVAPRTRSVRQYPPGLRRSAGEWRRPPAAEGRSRRGAREHGRFVRRTRTGRGRWGDCDCRACHHPARQRAHHAHRLRPCARPAQRTRRIRRAARKGDRRSQSECVARNVRTVPLRRAGGRTGVPRSPDR
jgi:hypothetical protein